VIIHPAAMTMPQRGAGAAVLAAGKEPATVRMVKILGF
jgi:hypothetical protein